MELSKRSIATLIDLVEIKLSQIEIFDREDAREVATLRKALEELTAANGTGAGAAAAAEIRRRGRRPKDLAAYA